MRVLRRASLLVVIAAGGIFGLAAPASAAVHMSVSPSTNLVDGQVVHVVLSGLPANALIGLAQCAPTATTFGGCDQRTVTLLQAGPGGGAKSPFIVARHLVVSLPKLGTKVDCRTAGCKIGVGGPLGGNLLASGPIAFNKTAGLAAPLQVALAINATGTVDTTTHIATVGGTVTCSRGSIIDVTGQVEQLIPFFGVWAVSRSLLTVDTFMCGDPGKTVPWTAEVGDLDTAYPGSFIVGFTTGKAKGQAFAEARAGGSFAEIEVTGKAITLSAAT